MQMQEQKQENIRDRLASASLSFQRLKKVINRSLVPSLVMYAKGSEEKLRKLFLLREADSLHREDSAEVDSAEVDSAEVDSAEVDTLRGDELRVCELSLIGIDKFNMVMAQKLITDPFINFLRAKIKSSERNTLIVLQGKMMMLLRYKVILEYSKVHSSDEGLLFDCDRLNKLEGEIKLNLREK